MKNSHSIKLIILFFYIISCGGNTHGENESIDSSIILKSPAAYDFKPGKIFNPVICKADPQQSYALYIPPHKSN